MSRSCDLTGVRAQTGRNVPIARSQTGVRTKRRFVPNIQNVSVLSDALGKVSLKLAVKTIRSIEHNGGIDQFLLKTSANKLAPKGKALKKQIVAKTDNKAPAEKPVRRQDKKSPKALKATAKKAAAGVAGAKPTAAKKKPAAKKAAK